MKFSVTVQLLALLQATWAMHDNSFCEITRINDKSVPVPGMPKIFWCSVTCQFLSVAGGKTLDVSELVDTVRNRGVMHIESKDMHQRFVYDYTKQQAITVDWNIDSFDPKSCKVQKLGDFKDLDLMGGIKGTDGKVIMNSPAAVFKLTDAQNKEYKGNKIVRGVRVNHWYACDWDSQKDLSYEINWYYSDPSRWTPADRNTTVVPVRITVKGKYNNGGRTFNHVYDISRFRTGFYGISSTAFQVPRGYYCDAGLSATLPIRPSQFQFGSEVINVGIQTVEYQREMYDFNSSLARMEYNVQPMDPEGLQFGGGRLVKVYDFERGVEYVKNLDMGNCTVTIIDPNDKEAKKTSNSKLVRMRSPDEFFYLDKKNAIYKGRQYARGLPVNVWMVQRDDYEVLPGVKVKASYEWGFAPHWIARRSGENVETLQPMWLEIRIDSANDGIWDGSVFQYTYYDYSSDLNNIWDLDIGTCFKDHMNKHYTLHFAATKVQSEYVMKNINEFRLMFSTMVVGTTGISPMRITNIDPSPDSSGIAVEFTINERPPIQGDVQNSQRGVPLADAVKDLTSSVAAGNFFMILTSNGLLLTADKDGLSEISNRTELVKDGYSPAAMVGLGFFVILLGFVLGFLGMIVFTRFRAGVSGVDLFKPQRFTNEA